MESFMSNTTNCSGLNEQMYYENVGLDFSEKLIWLYV